MAVVACWKYFFSLVAVICVLEGVSVVYDLNTGLTVARALVEAGTVFYVCATLLGLDLKSKDVGKKYSGFTLRYVFLLYVPVFAVAMIILFGFMPAFANSSNGQGILLGITVLASGIAYFMTMFLLGTVFPAYLLGVRKGIGPAIRRSFRQAAYLVPRILFGAGSVAVFGLVVLLLFERIGVGSDPVTPFGAPNIPGALVLLVVKVVSSFSFAVFSVIVCRAYLKDLREQGELPLAEAEVFA